MKPQLTRGILVASLSYLAVIGVSLGSRPTVELDENTGLGSVDTLAAAYNEWETDYVANGGDRHMILSLGPAKGLATRSSATNGRVTLDLVAGTISVEVTALPEGTWGVWLIENRSGSGRSVLPEPGDEVIHVGNLNRQEGTATLEARLGPTAFVQFDPDLVTVTRAGSHPAHDRLLVGTTSLFHRLYRNGQRGRYAAFRQDRESEPTVLHRRLWKGLSGFVSPTAHAQIGPDPNPASSLERLIADSGQGSTPSGQRQRPVRTRDR